MDGLQQSNKAACRSMPPCVIYYIPRSQMPHTVGCFPNRCVTLHTTCSSPIPQSATHKEAGWAGAEGKGGSCCAGANSAMPPGVSESITLPQASTLQFTHPCRRHRPRRPAATASAAALLPPGPPARPLSRPHLPRNPLQPGQQARARPVPGGPQQPPNPISAAPAAA